jgi:VanZ family protein
VQMSQESDEAGNIDIRAKLEGLRLRIKNTSSVRFYASRRVRTDYRIAQLTVVILSLWAIAISYSLATKLADEYSLDVDLLTGIGVILPVFIVVFSLLENGETFLRAFQLEANARQLRELSDQLYTSAAVKGLENAELLKVYDEFSQRYSDSLERTQVNHDDVDHFYRIYHLDMKHRKADNFGYIRIRLLLTHNWCKIQFKRCLYISLWFAPILLFSMRHPSCVPPGHGVLVTTVKR